MAIHVRPFMAFPCTCRQAARQHTQVQIAVVPSQLHSLAVRGPRISPFSYRHYASKKTLERKAANQKHPRQSTPPPRTHKAPPVPSSSTSHGPNQGHARPPATQPSSRTSNYLPTTTAYAQTLASRVSATTLYSSPPSNSLPVTTTTVSTFCFAYGAYHLYTNFVLPQPDGLWWGIPYAMGGVSILMLALGAWVRGTGRALVGRIEAIPAGALHRESDAAKAVRRHPPPEPVAAKHEKTDAIVLRITKKTVFPSFMRLGRPAATVLVAPQSCRLSSRLAQARAHGAYSPMHDRTITVQGQRTRVSAQEYAALEDEQRGLAKGPFAVFGGMLSAGLAGFGRIVTREGLVPLDVVTLGSQTSTAAAATGGRKMRWKVDVSEGAYLGDGALERLVQVK